MAKTLVTASQTYGFDLGPTTTAAANLAGQVFIFLGDTTDGSAQITMRTAGVFSKLYVNVSANAIVGATTLRFRNNDIDGLGAVSITSATTGEFTDTGVVGDRVASGDKVAGRFIPGDTTHIMTVTIISTLFEADNGNAVSVFSAWINAGLGVSATYYYHPNGSVDIPQTTENNVKLDMQAVGTWRNAGIFIAANGITNASTYTFRKNGAASPMTISIAGSTAGVFEDNTHTSTVVAGDDVCHQLVGGSAGTTITPFNSWVEFEDTASAVGTGLGINQLGATQANTESAATTVYAAIAGHRIFSDQTSETIARMLTRFDVIFSKLASLITANSVATSTIVLRVDAVDANNTLSIATNTTGYFTDSTHTDTVLSTSKVNYKFTTGAGTSIQLGYIHILSSPKPPQSVARFIGK